MESFAKLFLSGCQSSQMQTRGVLIYWCSPNPRFGSQLPYFYDGKFDVKGKWYFVNDREEGDELKQVLMMACKLQYLDVLLVQLLVAVLSFYDMSTWLCYQLVTDSYCPWHLQSHIAQKICSLFMHVFYIQELIN